MPILAVIGNKGGAGKTTLSINLGVGLARERSVAVVDADPQGSTLQWRAFARNTSMPVFEPEASLADQAARLGNEFQHVLFDCPPSVQAQQTLDVLEFADFVLIPVQPSPVDLWATVHTEEAINEAKGRNPNMRALLVINQLEPRTTMSQLVREALSEIALPMADTAIRRRAVYRNAALEGKTVYDMGARGRDAVAELDQLLQEIINP
ncbi:MAG: ParA family partition ATPase [bacterium]